MKFKGGIRIPTQNFELHRTVGKISLPYFDGSAKCTTNSWVQKLDTYFQLNPMVERYPIRMDAILLEGDASDFLFHGLIYLVYDTMTTYQ